MPKIFPYTESELLKIASRFNKNLKSHFHDLQGHSIELDRDFVFRFKAAFYESRIRPVDQEVDRLTLKLHQELGNLINAVHNLFQMFKYYIQKAFPHDSRMWDSFGYCEIENAIHDYAKLHECLKDFIELINRKKYELLDVNCPEVSFGEIEELHRKIEEKQTEILQINDLKEVSNESRLNSMNKLYRLMQVIHNTALVRLKNDPLALEKLTFPSADPDSQIFLSASA